MRLFNEDGRQILTRHLGSPWNQEKAAQAMSHRVPDVLEELLCSVLELFFWANQAQNQIALGWKIEEVTGMNEHACFAQKLDRQIFVRLIALRFKHRVPSAFRVEQPASAAQDSL